MNKGAFTIEEDTIKIAFDNSIPKSIRQDFSIQIPKTIEEEYTLSTVFENKKIKEATKPDQPKGIITSAQSEIGVHIITGVVSALGILTILKKRTRIRSIKFVL